MLPNALISDSVFPSFYHTSFSTFSFSATLLFWLCCFLISLHSTLFFWILLSWGNFEVPFLFLWMVWLHLPHGVESWRMSCRGRARCESKATSLHHELVWRFPLKVWMTKFLKIPVYRTQQSFANTESMGMLMLQQIFTKKIWVVADHTHPKMLHMINH